MYNKDTVSYGADWSLNWGKTILNNGFSVKFSYGEKINSMRHIDERNLIFCCHLNLCLASSLVELDLRYLTHLRLLIVWYSGIKTLDSTCTCVLEIIICDENQTITTNDGVIVRVMSVVKGSWTSSE